MLMREDYVRMLRAVFDAVPHHVENIRRGLAALEKALKEKTTVHRAMYRSGLGWVDFEWGDEGKWPPNAKGARKGGKGLVHIMEARQRKNGLSEYEAKDYLRHMVRIIAEGEIIPDKANEKRMAAIGIKGLGEVHLRRAGAGNAWVVTMFDPQFKRTKGE